MIISPNRQFVFIHLHKCAGTSIEMALAGALGINDIVVGSTPDGERLQGFFGDVLGLRKHASAAQVMALLGEERWAQFFTFAFVRHPERRMRSLYSYALKLARGKPLSAAEQAALDAGKGYPARPPFRFKAVQAAHESPSFEDFLRHPLTWEDPGARSQSSGLCDAQGRLLVQFVGKVEQIEQDWKRVEERLSVRLALPLANTSRPADEEPLSDAARALLIERAGEDFERFGYEA